MKKIGRSFQIGNCFGGAICKEFDNFLAAFTAATKEKFNYVVCVDNLLDGKTEETFVCWDNIQVVSYDQVLRRLEDPCDIKTFKERKNKGNFVLQADDNNSPVYYYSFMSTINFNRTVRISDRCSRSLKRRLCV